MLVIVALFVGTVIAQQHPGNLSPSEQERFLIRTTMERDFDQLMEAISTRDNGNYDLVLVYGMLGSGMEPRSITQALIRDARFRKLYQQLDAMPEREAASKAAEAFQAKLQQLKQASAANERIDSAQTYGIHAAMFLTFEFGDRNQFNQLFHEWNQWFNEQIAAGAYRQAFSNAPASTARRSFEHTRRPELLMYLNLVLIDQVRQSKSLDENHLNSPPC